MMFLSRTISGSCAYSLTSTWPTRRPTLSGSMSKTAAMLIPCSAKIEELPIAWPSRPAPTSAMLCWPWVRRIFRISPTRLSMFYPTPRLPNLQKAERSRRIWVALLFV